MRIELPDGSAKDLDDGASGADLAAAIGPGLARAALAIKVDGRLRDLERPLADGERVEIVTDRSPESLELIRHDTAHVLAAAVLDLYPGTKISIGPPIEDGFYYDFDFPDGVTVSDHDLPALEERMREHVKARERFTREDVSAGAAIERFLAEDQPYKNELTDLWRRENAARGYREVRTPILYDVELFKASGHWDVYRENMYFTEVEERSMGLKPMNCPAHIQLYKDARRSYRDLPIRYSEAGLVHRHEPSGTLHGLLRVRHITQDDAHIFCTEAQIEDEVQRCLDFGYAIYDTFGFTPRLELSTRPEKRIGAEDMWDRAEAALEDALVQRGVPFELNEGDGAFYGPKIDLHMTDSIGRSWQLGTVQLDYVMPERFELTYT